MKTFICPNCKTESKHSQKDLSMFDTFECPNCGSDVLYEFAEVKSNDNNSSDSHETSTV